MPQYLRSVSSAVSRTRFYALALALVLVLPGNRATAQQQPVAPLAATAGAAITVGTPLQIQGPDGSTQLYIVIGGVNSDGVLLPQEQLLPAGTTLLATAVGGPPTQFVDADGFITTASASLDPASQVVTANTDTTEADGTPYALGSISTDLPPDGALENAGSGASVAAAEETFNPAGSAALTGTSRTYTIYYDDGHTVTVTVTNNGNGWSVTTTTYWYPDGTWYTTVTKFPAMPPKTPIRSIYELYPQN